MKLYRCTKNNAELGTLFSWHSNRRDAEAELRQYQKERREAPLGPEGVEAVDVPTDKEGLIRWLNSNLCTNNG